MVSINSSKQHNQSAAMLMAILSLITIGLVFVYSSSSVFALEKFGESVYFFKKQLFFSILGICLLLTFRQINYKNLAKISPFIFLFFLSGMFLVHLPSLGHTANGSTRWISVGSTFLIQPVEFLKYALFIYISYIASKAENSRDSGSQRPLIPIALAISASALACYLQPDFGSLVLFISISFVILMMSPLPKKYILVSVFLSFPVLIAMVLKSEYRLKRIMSFLNPSSDPQGSNYQLRQSMSSIFNGGVFGNGLGNSKGKLYYLPEAHTDFIGSVIAEESGIVGFVVIQLIYLFIILGGLKIARKTTDNFGFYLAMSCTLVFSFQVCVNLGVIMGLLPTKGIALPFLSYGGSSLLANSIGLGLLLSVDKYGKA